MLTVHPSSLNGRIRVRPAKSILHRQIVCAALGKGRSRIYNFIPSDDVAVTLNAVRDMGLCTFDVDGDTCIIDGGKQNPTKEVIDCGESGSTLRFLLPLACDGQPRTFTGHGRLMERPMQPYTQLFAGHNVEFAQNQDGIRICGQLKPGAFRVDGTVSSQFISGLLFKLPLLEAGSTIQIENGLESAPYVELTQQVQEKFGVKSDYRDGCFHVDGIQAYNPADTTAEGDYSHAAFFAVAAAISGKITFDGLLRDSAQGDKQIFDILNCMGIDVNWEENRPTVEKMGLKPAEVDVSQIPDLLPVLAVLACAAQGKTRLFNAARLRFKESDRLSAMATELEALGGDVVEYEDSLVINGSGTLRGGHAHTHNDHRIAMALTIAACIAEGDIILDQPDVVSKSAPDFYREFESLGGKLD